MEPPSLRISLTILSKFARTVQRLLNMKITELACTESLVYSFTWICSGKFTHNATSCGWQVSANDEFILNNDL